MTWVYHGVAEGMTWGYHGVCVEAEGMTWGYHGVMKVCNSRVQPLALTGLELWKPYAALYKDGCFLSKGAVIPKACYSVTADN